MAEEFQEVVEPESTETAETSEQQEPLATVGSEEEAQGPIPFTAHKQALENARTKALEEAESRYSFLGGRDANEILAALQHYDYLSQDQDGYTTYLASRNPKFRSKLFGEEKQQEDEYPKPVLDNYTGQYYYSQDALKKINDINEKKFNARLEEALKPLQERFQQSDVQYQQTQLVNNHIETLAATLPFFDEYLEEIVLEMGKDARLSAEGAYKRVWDTKIQPTIKRQEKAATVDALKKKARASSEARPIKGNDSTVNGRKYARGISGWDAAFADVEAEQR